MTRATLNRIDQIKSHIRKYAKKYGSAKETALLEQAFDDIEDLFNDQWRYSGEPVLIHSLRVGNLLCQSRADLPTVIAGLLHDLIEDTPVTYDYIKAKYGKWYADIVESLSKEKNIRNTHMKLVSAGKRDIRSLIIKMYDRLDNMRELQWMPIRKQNRISHETMDFYVPLATEIGVPQKITNELKDLSMTYQS